MQPALPARIVTTILYRMEAVFWTLARIVPLSSQMPLNFLASMRDWVCAKVQD